MKQFTELQQLLDYIVEIARENYSEGFYNIKPEFDDDGYTCCSMTPLVVRYKDKLIEFFGGIVPFSRMATSFEYKNIYFRACESELDSYTRIAWAPNKDMLFDECWCIEIPIEVHNAIYSIEKICL